MVINNLVSFVENIGRYITMLALSVSRPEKARMYWIEMMRQANSIGIESIPIVVVVAVFLGAVTAVQFAYQIQNFPVPEYYLGYIVRDVMVLEMAPTLTCMILTGKVGSNMASELGNMRISNQISALDVMGVNSTAYLVGTKIMAAIFSTPVLVVVAAFIGIIGGLIAALASNLCTVAQFVHGLRTFFVPYNFILMLLKSLVFAFIFSSVACKEGYYTEGGAIEIGKASTRSVVLANILILFFDYVIAALFISKLK